MRNQSLLALLTVILIGTTQGLFAQDTDSESAKPAKKSSLKFGVDYLSNNVFMGRTDTLKSPIIAPGLTYTFASGLFLAAAVDFIPSRPTNKVDDGSLAIGYNYSLSEQLEGSISFTKMFYAGTSTQISSSISSEITASLDYSNDYLTPGLTIDYTIGKKTSKNDIFINPTLSHDFIVEKIFGDEDFLTISPTAGLNMGSQNFYDSYLTFKRKIKNPKIVKAIANYRESLSHVRLLDYELSAPVNYSFSPFLLSFTPTLAIPENKLAKIITAGQQNKSTQFYFDLGLSIKF